MLSLRSVMSNTGPPHSCRRSCRRMGAILIAALSILHATAVVAVNPLKTITSRLGRTSVQVEKFEPCPEYPDTPIRFSQLVISHDGLNKFVLSGKIDIRETMDHPLKLIVEMYRCSSKDSAGSCEYYFTFKKDGICELLKNNDNTWDFFTNGTDLPSQCPFDRGSYTINEATINLKELRFVPWFKSHWKLKNHMYHEEQLMFCLISEFTLDSAA